MIYCMAFLFLGFFLDYLACKNLGYPGDRALSLFALDIA